MWFKRKRGVDLGALRKTKFYDDLSQRIETDEETLLSLVDYVYQEVCEARQLEIAHHKYQVDKQQLNNITQVISFLDERNSLLESYKKFQEEKKSK